MDSYITYLRDLAVKHNVYHQDCSETGCFKFYVNFNPQQFAKVLRTNGLTYVVEHASEELTVYVVARTKRA
jgi:hypothetical protein